MLWLSYYKIKSFILLKTDNFHEFYFFFVYKICSTFTTKYWTNLISNCNFVALATKKKINKKLITLFKINEFDFNDLFYLFIIC